MVNPIGPIDESQNIAPADLSTMGMEASGATRSQEAERIANTGAAKTTKPTLSTIQEWRSFSAAKQAISSLMDKVSNIISKPSVGNSPAATFDDAKQNMEAAKLQLQSATDMNAFKAGWLALQDAVKEMESLATDATQQAEVSALKTQLADKQATVDQILELDTALTNLDKLLQDLQTTSSMDFVQSIKGLVTESQQKIQELLDKLEADGVTSPVIDDTKAKIEATHSQLLQLADALQAIYDAGKGSLSAVESANNNNSLANINASKEIIKAARETLDKLSQLAPNSPIVQKAQQEVSKAEQLIDTIVPSGLGSLSESPSVSSSQSSKGKNISEKRLALLLDSVDNTSASLMMQGFRSMIQGFYNQSDEMQQGLGDFSQEVESSLQQLAAERPDAESELQQVEDALFTSDGSASDDFANALASIALASVKLGGGTSAQANQVGSDVKQLYDSSKPAALRKPQSLRSGYESWQRLNTAYAGGKESVRNVLNQAMSPALSTSLPKNTASRSESSGDLSQNVARSIVTNSRTIGDVYQSLQIFERGLHVARQTSDISSPGFQQKLTEDITKPPGFGYPYMQLADQSEQKFIAELEEAFVNGSRELAEKQEAEFTTNTQYIQQVLTNIASLFSVYLQN